MALVDTDDSLLTQGFFKTKFWGKLLGMLSKKQNDLGINSSSGSSTKFLNEQGNFVTVSGTYPDMIAGTANKTFTVRRLLTNNNYSALLKISVSGSSLDAAYSGAIFSFTSRSNGCRNINGLIVVNPFEWNSYEIVAKTIILGERVISRDNDIPIFYIRQSVVNNKWYYEIWCLSVSGNSTVTINALNCSMNSIEELTDTSETMPERMTECDLYKNVVAKTNTNSANYSMVGSTSIPVYVDTDGSLKPCNIRFISVSGSWTAPNVSGDAKFTLYNDSGSSVSLVAGSLSKLLLDGEYCDLLAVNGTWKKFSNSYV